MSVAENAIDLKKVTEPSKELAEEIEAAATKLEDADALEIVSWAVDRFGNKLVAATSFQDLVLVDLVHRVQPTMQVIFLDTGFHFPETLSFLEESRASYDLNLLVTQPEVSLDEFPCGSPRCCEFRKVAPLNKALLGTAAWLTGVKRIDTPERTDAPVVSWDKTRVKINPLATWTDDDVDRYIDEHKLARHPLNALGYISIGCAPTTRPVAAGENPRDGRWPDSEKTECGLHI